MTEHVFWLTSRSAGIVALLASSASVGLGLLMAGRMIRGKGAELRSIHEALSLATMAAIVIHAGATALFLAAFSGLYVQMATGHDPVLGTSTAQVGSATQATTSSTSSSTATSRDSQPMTTAAS